MIVRDSKHTLEALFSSIKGVFDQIVVVDTGSKDGTVKWLSEKYPEIQLEHFKWCFDFSKARNFSLSKLETDYGMWLDSDDIVDNKKTLLQNFNYMLENTHLTHLILEYQYSTDTYDNASIQQFRERIIKNPKEWEWREPIHEVCCYIGKDKEANFVSYDCKIIHKPKHSIESYNNRNWNILNRDLFENPLTSHRTLYYIQKEALAKKQFEYSIHIGLTLFKLLQEANQVSGHYFHECTKNLGEAFLETYRLTKDNLFLKKAEEVLRIAIDKQPEFNEPRIFLIDVLLLAERYHEALDLAESLKEEIPKSLFCIYPINYGKFKYAKLAEISIRYMEDFNSAIHYHLISKDTEIPCSIIFENEQLIRNYMELYNIGLVYASPKYFEQAQTIKQYLINNGIFDGVAITTCVAAVGNARKIYFHLSDEPNSVYMEDGHPHLLKYYCNDICPTEPPYGYEYIYLEKDNNCFKESLDSIFTEHPVVMITKDIVKTFYEFRCKKYLKFDRFVYIGITPSICDKTYERGKITFIINDKQKLVGIAGTIKLLGELNIVKEKEKLIIYAPDLNKISWDSVNIKKGLEFTVKVNFKKKLVIFCAGGWEEWDGNTPFRYGIGASESSLIYLAEEFVKQDCEVIVYNTVTYPRIIAGVKYLPRPYMGDIPSCDLFVSSRMPEVLTTRRAKIQALWMHDLPTAYIDKINYNNVDLLIAVSEWEKKFAINQGMPKEKVIVIPNGIYDIFWVNKPEKIKGSSVWVSDPLRGVHNLIDINKKTGLFNNLTVLYGFYFTTFVKPTKDQFNASLVVKTRLRDMGARICGRVNNAQTRQILSSTHYLAYPSDFPETQCVSVLEALAEAVQVFLNKNGATVATAFSSGLKGLINVVFANKYYEKADLPDWCAFLLENVKEPCKNKKKLNRKHHWPVIIKTWLALMEDIDGRP